MLLRYKASAAEKQRAARIKKQKLVSVSDRNVLGAIAVPRRPAPACGLLQPVFRLAVLDVSGCTLLALRRAIVSIDGHVPRARVAASPSVP